jgi:MarR family transcriptional regulator, negative regulator of the multidrug operon emrRAB
MHIESPLMNRLSNLLGALALAISDEQARQMHEASGLGESAVAALTTLGAYPSETLAALSGVLGLTHSATVRLADDLVKRGLIERQPGNDKRSVALRLTGAGEAVRTQLMQARERTLTNAVAAVDAADRDALERMVSRILAELTASRSVADHMCRLCDEVACGQDSCPVECRAVEIERSCRT